MRITLRTKHLFSRTSELPFFHPGRLRTTAVAAVAALAVTGFTGKTPHVSESISLVVAAPDSAARDSRVPIRLIAKNSGTEVSRLALIGVVGGADGQITFDVRVESDAGTTIWRLIKAVPGLPGYQSVVVATAADTVVRPGEQLEWRTEWDQRSEGGTEVARGRYSIVGMIPSATGPALVSAPHSIILY